MRIQNGTDVTLEPLRTLNIPPILPPNNPRPPRYPLTRTDPALRPAQVLPAHRRRLPLRRFRPPHPPEARWRVAHGLPHPRVLRRTDALRAQGPAPAGAEERQAVLHQPAAEPAGGLGDAE